MVQLDCVNCHSAAAVKPDLTYSDTRYLAESVTYKASDVVSQTDREAFKSPRPSSGRERMTPPKFANACAACHLLTFDKRFEEGAPHDTPEVIHT